MAGGLRGVPAAALSGGLRWRLVDARAQVVGRLAARLAVTLQGKDKPDYAPEKDGGDMVVVVNAQEAVLTGRKMRNKLYRWHTGYPGGLKERTAEWMKARDPASLLREAVEGMLPKNKLRKARMRKLRIFPGEEHDFQDMPLEPLAMPPRNIKPKVPLAPLRDGFEPCNPEEYAKRMEIYGLAPPDAAE